MDARDFAHFCEHRCGQQAVESARTGGGETRSVDSGTESGHGGTAEAESPQAFEVMNKHRGKPKACEIRTLADLTPDKANARKHGERNIGMLERSLEQYGAARSIVVDENGKILAGHGVVEAAANVGIEKVVPVEASGNEIIAVVRRGLTEKQKTELALADNRTAELAEWSPEILKSLSEDVDLGKFWTEKELALLIPGAEVSEGPAPQLDKAVELQRKWKTERGQVWEIRSKTVVGKFHRLACIDSLNLAHVESLVCGVRPDLANLDPPYGIGIVRPRNNGKGQVGGSKPFGSVGAKLRKSSNQFGSVQRGPKSKKQIIQSNVYPVIQGDDKPFDPKPFLNVAKVVLLWGANYYADKLPISSCWICWDKREDITRNTFADCELAWCSAKAPARVFHHLWSGLFKGSQYGEPRTHPTERPVALFAEIGKFYAPNGVWLDLFAGTGAQLVAGEQCASLCLAAEIEPLYVAVALQRMQDMGLEPKLAEAVTYG